MIFGIIYVCLVGCILIDAAPRPLPKARPQGLEVFQTESVYPNYFLHQPPPFSFNPYPNPFYHGAYVQNLNSLLDFNGKKNGTHNDTVEGKLDKLWDPKSFGFDSAAISTPQFKSEDLAAAFKANAPKLEDFKTRVITFEGLDGINVVNPFIAGKTIEGKIVKADNGIPVIKAGKPNDTFPQGFSIINPFSHTALDPVFGPEIAPRYEIHYTLGDNYNFEAFPFNFDFGFLGSPFGFGGADNKTATAAPGAGGEDNSSNKPELADTDSSSNTDASSEQPSGETSSESSGDTTTASSSSERKRRQRLNKRNKPRH